MARIKLKKQKTKVDSRLFFLTISLTTKGLIAVADASAPQALSYFSDKLYFVKQQAVSALIGIIALFVVSKIHYSVWEKLAKPVFFISVLLLIAVLIPGIGSKALGARRWIVLGSVNFQPSEIVKLTLAMYLAKVASSKKQALSYFLPIAFVAGLVMFQPDLGTVLVISTISFVQVFIAGVNILHISAAGAFATIAGFLLIIMSDYRKDRLLTFLQVTKDPLGKSYHIRQVLLALGSGGLFGVGLGQSRQKYLFLPEAATDSIFAVIAEEVGFIGATILIVMFILFIISAFKIARGAPDNFSRVLASGLVAWIGGQAFLNIGSMVALIPLTGIPLPFLSYGGSSLVTMLIATGILLNISRYAKKAK